MSYEKVFKLDHLTIKCDHDRFMAMIDAVINEDEFSDEYDPHTVAEAMCWKCGKRWIAAFPSATLLKELECPGCGEVGHVFLTGQGVVQDD